MQPESTVFVVDDDPDFRKSLRWLIESVELKVETHASAQEFLDAYTNSSPGCVVLDVRMPGMSGLELQEHLQADGVDIPIIIVTAYGDVPMAVRAMKGGAVNFIEKPFNDQLLLDQIQQAIAEDVKQRQNRAEQLAVVDRIDRLTPREGQVLALVVAGKSSKDIAADLGVSIKTIESRRARIRKKMEANSVAHLIRISLSAQQSINA